MPHHTSHNKSDSILPATLSEISPEGGLLSLELDIFWDKTEEFLKSRNITTTEQLLGLILMMHAFGDTGYVPRLIGEGQRQGLLTKRDVVNIYLMQDEEVRRYRPILTLDGMIQTTQFAPLQKERGSGTALLDWISQDDVLTLANQVITVATSDLDTIFKQWFYRSEEVPVLSREFFAYWFKESERGYREINGKTASLLAIAYQKKYPEDVSLQSILSRFEILSRNDPDSHGTYRYLSLAFYIAGESAENHKLIIDAWVHSIEQMMMGGKSLYRGAQMSIEFLIREKQVPDDMKEVALQKIQMTAESVAREYSNLIAKAKKFVDEF